MPPEIDDWERVPITDWERVPIEEKPKKKEISLLRSMLPTVNEAGRMAMQTGGAVVGGLAGAASPVPGGTVMGGVLGYAAANKLADLYFGDRPANEPSASLPRQAWEEIKQTGGDIATGAAYEAMGPLAKLAAKIDVGLATPALKSLFGRTVKQDISDMAKRYAERKAGERLASAVTKEPVDVALQIAKNEAESEFLEKNIPGLKFNIGERGGDPNLLSLARQKAQQPGTIGPGLSAEETMTQNAALQDYIKKNITGTGDVRDFLSAIREEQGRLGQLSRGAEATTETVVARTAGREAQDIGRGLRGVAEANKRISSQRGAELYGAVPEDLKIEGTPLLDRINRLRDEFDRRVERLSSNPSSEMNRVEEIFGPRRTGVTVPPRPFTATIEQSAGSLATPESGLGGYDVRIAPGPYGLESSIGHNVPYQSRAEAQRAADRINTQNAERYQTRLAETPSISEQPSYAVTVGQMKKFRSQISTIQREAKARGDWDLANSLNELKTGVNETLGLAAQQGQGEGVEALARATEYWRDIYVPTYRQSATGQILRTNRTGESTVVDSAVGGEWFKPGVKGVAEAHDSFVRTFGESPEARGLLRDYAAQSLLKEARSAEGDITSKGIARWKMKYSDALKKYGLQDEFGSLEQATARMNEAKRTEATFNKSSLAKALDSDSDKAISAMLMTGTGKKQSINRLKEMVSLARIDQTGAASNGLRAGIGEYFEREIGITIRDLAERKLESLARVDKFLKDFAPALKSSGLYTPAQIHAWDNVQKSLLKIARQATPTAGYTGSATADLLTRAAASGTSFVLGHFGVYGAALKAYTLLEKPMRDQIDNALVRAIYDPRYAEAIMSVGQKFKPEMVGLSPAVVWPFKKVVNPEKVWEVPLKKINMLDQMTGRAMVAGQITGVLPAPIQGTLEKVIPGWPQRRQTQDGRILEKSPDGTITVVK